MGTALPDGTRRPGFANEKERAKLEVIKSDLPPSQRGAIQKEINDLRRSKK
jgi:hypothetical protein